MKVKYQNSKFWAYQDYEHQKKWVPFWSHYHDAIQKKLILATSGFVAGQEYEIEGVYLSNCGPKCTGAWPDHSCGNCGGYGVGAALSEV